MSKQESYSVLTEPEADFVSTTRHLTVQVDKETSSFMIEGAGNDRFPATNDDTVVWHFKGITKDDKPAIVFTDKLDSKPPGDPDDEPKISIAIHENKPDSMKPWPPYEAHYEVTLDGKSLIFKGTSLVDDPTTSPSLVIDGLGKPPGRHKPPHPHLHSVG